MIIEARVPSIGESINEVTLSKWLIEDGAYVELDQSICEFESDKATLEFPAEKAGIVKYVAKEDQDLNIGDVVCTIDTSAKAPLKADKPKASQSAAVKEAEPTKTTSGKPEKQLVQQPATAGDKSYASGTPSVAAAKIMRENGLSASHLSGSGKDGRITKADVILAIQNGVAAQSIIQAGKRNSREQHTEKMSKLRRTIAKRLVAVKNETAMLTTFNEVDMGPIMEIRTKYKEKFREKHGVNLGYMSFFGKACCNALMEFPAVNAYIDDNQLIYNDFCDISIAVSTERGLVVPVLRNAESMSMHEIEAGIKELAIKARNNQLSLEEMTGGTFTITNGGVFGSLMSTPIINSPQSAILGMHKIEERPIALNGQVVIRPMMYLAVSYDHRIIDGKESVSFLVRVKEQLENPEQLLFGADPIHLLLDL